ncbi:MAG: type III pantothenate kinase [Coriobacteriales bacterium]|nr:type III pantothenate kinase [Coriobacteriales bacterium]
MTRLLTIDIGNTQTSIGVFKQDKLVERINFNSKSSTLIDQIKEKFLTLNSLNDLDDICIASVVPSLNENLKDYLTKEFGLQAKFINSNLKFDFKFNYPNSQEIGADRLADAQAAVKTFGYPVCVCDFGTATNNEVNNENSAFGGGILTTRIETSIESLFKKTEKINAMYPSTKGFLKESKKSLDNKSKIIANNTRDAIYNGLIFGEALRIDALLNKIFDELGYQTQTIATGGLCTYIEGLSKVIKIYDKDLTLYGIQSIYKNNFI